MNFFILQEEGNEEHNNQNPQDVSAYSCGPNNVACFENIFLGIICILSAALFIISFKKILNDKNNILDKMDKILFFFAILQMISLSLYFLLLQNTFALASIRAFRLATEILICMVFLYIHIEKENQKFYFKIMQFSLIGTFALWFYCAILHQDYIAYKCTNLDYLLFSTCLLIVSSLIVIIGFMIVFISNEFARERNINQDSVGQNKISNDEFNTIKFQLYIFMIGGFISALIQFLWDYIAYMNSYQQSDCENYFNSHDVASFLYFIILKIITLIVPPYIIFYIFYYRNRNFFEKANNLQERNLKVFYDARSDLLEEMELEEIEQSHHQNNQSANKFFD